MYLPIKHGDIPASYVRLPEGRWLFAMRQHLYHTLSSSGCPGLVESHGTVSWVLAYREVRLRFCDGDGL